MALGFVHPRVDRRHHGALFFQHRRDRADGDAGAAFAEISSMAGGADTLRGLLEQVVELDRYRAEVSCIWHRHQHFVDVIHPGRHADVRPFAPGQG